MGNIGWWQIAIVVVLVVLLFGRGKISELMGDVATGIKNFRKGLSEEDEPESDEDVAFLQGNGEGDSETAENDKATQA